MIDRRLIHAVGFIDDELISQAAEYCPATKKSNPQKAKFFAFGCAAAVVAAIFALNIKNVTRDKDAFMPEDSSNSASVGTSGLAMSRTLEEWLSDPAVVWGEVSSKDGPGVEDLGKQVPLGNTVISGKWLSEITYGTVYAVMVDFSPCIDKAGMENWKFDGDTISALKAEYDGYFYDTGETCEVSYFKDGVLHTEYEPIYSSDPENSERIFELEQRIEELTSVYYSMKIDSFRESFAENGLGVYVLPYNDSTLKNSCFYTFAMREQLENFKCKENEAFFFMPAFRFK